MIAVPAPALARLQLQPVADVFATEQSQIVRGIVVFFVSLVVVYAIARFVLLRVVLRAMQSRNVESSIVSLGRLVGQVVSAFIAFGIAFALAGFGSVLTALAALSGALTIAVGLAANDIIANLLAGLYIINERLFRVGDWIEWEDKRGRVERIDLRVTRVRTFDNELVAVPNSTLANTAITNPVAFGRIRVPVQFNVGYGDIDRATELIIEEAERFPEVLSDPTPSVRITELSETYVGLKARLWMGEPSRADFNRLRTTYITNVIRRLVSEGIEPDPSHVLLSGGVDIRDGVGSQSGTRS